MGFFLWLIGLLTQLRSKAKNGKEEFKENRHKWTSKLAVDSVLKTTKLDKVTNTNSVGRKVVGKTIEVLAVVIAFIETFILIYVALYILLILVVVFFIVLLIIYLTSLLNAVVETPIQPDFSDAVEEAVIDSNYRMGSSIAWTMSELNANLAVLTPREQNIYRLGILAKDSVNGYGVVEYFSGIDRTLAHKMMLGVASIETGMNFYSDGRQDDITKVPSDKKLNSSNYGVMGLSGSLSYSNYIANQAIRNEIARMYPLNSSYKSSMSYDAQYFPWSVMMSTQFMDKEKLGRAKQDRANMEKVADQWGIKAKKDELVDLMVLFLNQALYHGAHSDEFEGYYHFWAALFYLTSDNDEERSFSKWTLKNNYEDTSKNYYDESSFRITMMGTMNTNHRNLGKLASPMDIPKGSTKTVIMLNGKEINEPLWTYVWKELKDKEGMKKAWQTVQKISNYTSGSGGIKDRTLNFHYGLNSYLQGNRIYDILGHKLVKSFVQSPGKGQATVNGVSTDEFIDSWLQKQSTTAKNYIAKIRSTWGTTSSLTSENTPNQSNLAVKGGYVDAYFGVPFYGQGSRFGESYGTIPWHWTQGIGDTYNISGCMVYACAYAASAMTGKLINPTEMGAILIAFDALGSGGISTGKVDTVMRAMGLEAKYYDSIVTSWEKVKSALRQGAVVVFRAPGPTAKSRGMNPPPTKGGYEFAATSNHFMTLNGIEEKNGVTYFHLYSSSDSVKSNKAYTEAKMLDGNIWKQAIVVWNSSLDVKL